MITPFYAALIALLFVTLSLRTLWLGRGLGIAIGTGNDERLAWAMRVHPYGVSNMSENYRFRVAGMVLTLGCLISAAVRLLLGYIG